MRTVPTTPAPAHRAAQHSPAMEQQPEQQQQAEQQEQRDWASLPGDLLRMCLSAAPLRGDEPSSRAALATCRAFARAVVHTSLRGLYWPVDLPRSVVPSAKLLEALWDGEQHNGKGASVLVLVSTIHSSSGRCVAELVDAGVRLTFVRHLGLQGLSLDALIPSGVGVLLPNLEQLFIAQCCLAPEAKATALDASCSKLREVHIRSLSVEAPAAPTAVATAQLKQLAKLPSLSAIALDDASCPTLFLLALSTQLTRLELHSSYQQCLPNTQTPTPGWKATLQQVARCTRLQELTIPCVTAAELGLVAPALQQLRTLHLNTAPLAAAGVDGDAMMEVLLGLPHLTRVQWENCATCIVQGLYTDSQQQPCRWEELIVAMVSVRNLARLPLHSLNRPVAWSSLLVDDGITCRQARAAVANVTRNCPAGFNWRSNKDTEMPCLACGDQSAEVLVALQPLLVPLASLAVDCTAWHVKLVKVLGQVLPHTCTCLALRGGSMSRKVLEQVATSLGWLATLQLRGACALPQDVVQYVRTARSSIRGNGGVAQPALGMVKVMQPVRPEGMSEVQHRRAWEEAVREVQRVSEGAVALVVQWS